MAIIILITHIQIDKNENVIIMKLGEITEVPYQEEFGLVY